MANWHKTSDGAARFNGSVLMFLCLSAFINAVGGFWGQARTQNWTGPRVRHRHRRVSSPSARDFYERRANQRVRSNLLRLDAQSWLMSALIASATGGFCLGHQAIRERASLLRPCRPDRAGAVDRWYLITVPIRTVRQALNEILLITPPNLDRVVRAVKSRWSSATVELKSPRFPQSTRAMSPRSGALISSRFM